jgi:hypothetical protein
MITLSAPSSKFYLFAFVIAILGAADAFRTIKNKPVSTPPSTQPSPAASSSVPSNCFAGDKVVIGYQAFDPLMRSGTPQPSGFTRDVVDKALHDIGCQKVEWKQYAEKDPQIDLVVAPPATIDALLKSGAWTVTRNYAVVNLEIVKNIGREFDPQSSIVIEERWFPLLQGRYPNTSQAADAVTAFVGHKPRAAITSPSTVMPFDAKTYEAVPLPVQLRIGVAKRREQSLPTLDGSIGALKEFIAATARNQQISPSVTAAD